MKKILLGFFVFIMCVSFVLGYGGSAGGGAVFINDKIDSQGNLLSHLTLNNKQTYETTKFSDKSVLRKLSVSYNSKVTCFVDVYELESENADKLYPEHDFYRLLKIDSSAEIDNMTLELELDSMYVYKFLHELSDGSWIEEEMEITGYSGDKVIYRTQFTHLSYFALVTQFYEEPAEDVVIELNETNNTAPILTNLTVVVENETFVYNLTNSTDLNENITTKSKISVINRVISYLIGLGIVILGLFGLMRYKQNKQRNSKIDVI